MERILCSKLGYPNGQGLGITRSNPAQEKKGVGRTYNLLNFSKMSATKSQTAVEDIKNKEKIKRPSWVYYAIFSLSFPSWLSFLALEINKPFLILIKAK